VDLRLQVPGSSSGYLLEVLLDEARGAERGGAMFSFASAELAAFRGTTPPPTPPVIGVYVRLPQGSFLYQRVAPGEDGYDALAGFLDEQWVGRTDRLRRVAASVSDVRGAWPDSPLWSVELPSS
jgi:hypothetical protein